MKHEIEQVSFNCFSDILREVEKDMEEKRMKKTDIINQILLEHYKERLKK